MQKVRSLVFRKLTDADFFNINKPPRTEHGGGGQSYIDFPTSAVKISNWREFLRGIPETKGTNGPWWKFNVRSLGTTLGAQEVTIAQRRAASVSIRSQKLHSRENKRISAWKPDVTGFPQPADPRVRNHIYDLHIYIARLDNDQYWAGWFQASGPEPNWPINDTLNLMFTKDQGYIKSNGTVFFDESDPTWPFRIASGAAAPLAPIVPAVPPDEEEGVQEKVFFDADEIAAANEPPKIKESIRKIRLRNTKAVKKLKGLYRNLCQISGATYTFKKLDNSYYSEAHHLIPLGEGGSDSVYNIVIVSPLIHRMLHYAKVENLDLKNIKDNKLLIKINGTEYVITWHPDHAKVIQELT